jgi:hypothetical protein
MKKQLLILFLALFAIGLSSSYGQDCPLPRPVDVTCLTSDALHPVAGTPYDYTITVPTPPGTREFTWFVTQEQNFIAAGILTPNREIVGPSALIAATGSGYNDPATGTATVNITWKAFVYDPSAPVFVVIHVKNAASTPDLCVTNNMKVYKIEPQIAFTLDIANVTKVGVTQDYEDTIARCLHDVVSATYSATPAPDGSVIYDFGADTLYYVVTAANYTISWLPATQLAGLDANETIDKVEWDTSFAFNAPVAMNLAAGTYTSVSPAVVRNAANAVGPEGECIWIRVIIDHSIPGVKTYEGLTDETITLAVDGTTNLASPTPVGDMHYSSTEPVANALCGLPDGFQFDLAVQKLKPRPDIQDATPPAGDDFLPVQP